MAAPTPMQWLGRLLADLSNKQADIHLMNRFYGGEHPLPFLTKAHERKVADEFRTLLEESRSNFMRLVVDAVEERLRVDGFRLSARDDQGDDQASWEIWQANGMDAESQTAFTEALVKGTSYLLVWPSTEAGKPPVISVEDPLETVVAYEPGSNFRRRAAALKTWKDDWTGLDRANVYLPDGIYKFERRSGSDEPTAKLAAKGDTFGEPTSPARAADALTASSGWVELPDEFVANPLRDVVPIVPLRNRPRLLVEGESELADVFRIQSQINGFLFLLAIAGYFGAHRQRWMVGAEMGKDDNGRPIEPFNVAVDRLWHSENPDVKFGEFEQTSLDGYIKAIEQKILHIAVTTRTPRHYLIEQGQSPSGDAIKSAESGLTKKVERKQRVFGEGLEEALRLARRFNGQADSVNSEIVWSDPSIRTEAEITDAAIKKWSSGLITWHQACEDVGYSATQIARMLDAFKGLAPVPSSITPPADPAAA
jgi:hypothetical protein